MNDFELTHGMNRRLEKAFKAEMLSGADPLIDDNNIDIDTYYKMIGLDSSDEMLSKHRVYLDMNFWIWMREAAAGNPRSDVIFKLWGKLSDLADRGKVVCPISYTVFKELLKQSPERRAKSSEIVDRLAGRYCIVNPQARLKFEVSHFVWKTLIGVDAIKDVDRYVWMPISHLIGMPYPVDTNLDVDLRLKMQKSWIKFTSYLKFSDFCALTINMDAGMSNRSNFVSYQNTMSDITRESLESREVLYKIEVGEMTDLIEADLHDFAMDLYGRGYRSCLGLEDSGGDLARSIACIVTAGLKTKKITTQLPQYHIGGALHTNIRWMRRPHDKNDLEDQHHAIAALPYCDAFFTEHGLRESLTCGPFRLHEQYDCFVCSDPAIALEYVEGLT